MKLALRYTRPASRMGRTAATLERPRRKPIMKSRIMPAVLLAASVLFTSACSSTRTQQAPGEVIDDSLLTAKVKAALIEDPATKAGQINVETYRGVVQLGGFVDTADSKARATQVASGVSGV